MGVGIILRDSLDDGEWGDGVIDGDSVNVSSEVPVSVAVCRSVRVLETMSVVD